MTTPARLLSVRLQGFKSFVDRTHVEFGPGISAVVGPNGSGKSNLADALRWALGEQGRALRSRKSEDVIWAGSERRPAVGMADVQLTLDNADGLLPVEYGVVELGRRLYRSGENDYLLNRQRVRLKDLVDLLDAGHLAENAFLFIGQGMVDQALALRPEERRPLFEEVAGVRRHERRRRRAEEQLAESEANLARVDDILGELRPQARRLAQQAEQQANRRTAGDDLAAALLLSAHARWHAAAGRAAAAAAAARIARTALDETMAALLEDERAMTAAADALAAHATAEAAARADLDGLRAALSALQLREARLASELDAVERERERLESARRAAGVDLDAARQSLAAPPPASAAAIEEELASIDADLAGLNAPVLDAESTGLSASDAAAIRRLEAARAEEIAASRRRATEAERHAADETSRAATAAAAAARLDEEHKAAVRSLEAAHTDEAAARSAREAAQADLIAAESTARLAAERASGAGATATALAARSADAERALEAADGSGFSRAARARGGRSIADGLIVEPSLRAAVDAALAGIGRAQVVARAEIEALSADRGVAIASEAIASTATAVDGVRTERIVDAARAAGGGPLADAVRRDDSGAVRALIARAVWLPTAAACLGLQRELPAGWVAVARDGSVVVGEVATWIRPQGLGLHLRADAERLAAEAAESEATATAARAAASEAASRTAEARSSLGRAREHEAQASAAARRAEEHARAAGARAEAASREAAWLAAQSSRLEAEARRLRAAVPADPTEPEGPTGGAGMDPSSDPRAADVSGARAAQRAELQARRDEVAAALEQARAGRAAADRERAQAEASAALAERQLAAGAAAAADLAERHARLAIERQDVASQLSTAVQGVAAAEAALEGMTAGAAAERSRIRAMEAAVAERREAARIGGERARLAERDDVEARLALEGLREQLLVELAGLGPTGLAHLRSVAGAGGGTSSVAGDPIAGRDPDASTDDVEPDDLEAAIDGAAASWAARAPEGEPPPPGRLATLRRRFHELGAVNPFAAEEYEEVRVRLDALEAQRADLQGAIDSTRSLIAELDRLVTDQFRRTFEALERAFDGRFQQLFGGGYARLALTDPDDLARTGVEITARPPGKKAQALAMLSGGERALTAVALLFAMLTVRPVPFCVLDEVDAALDEANIGRFTDALQELARATQCIVITHNRGTIEAADALYGVTVGDDSASRVISLRLEEATALASRARRASAPVGETGVGAAADG